MAPPLLLGTALLAALALLSAALGRRLLHWLPVGPTSSAERALFAIALGAGALQALPFTLLALGIATPLAFRIAVATAFVVLIPDAIAVIRAAYRSMRVSHLVPGPEIVTLGVLAVVMTATLLRAVCPTTDDDGLSYHLAAAVRYLAAGRFVYLPTLTYANWPQGVEMMFVLVRGIHPAAPVGTVQLFYGFLTVCAIYLLARRLGGQFAATTAVALSLVYGVFWEEMAEAHVDVGTALFATMSVFALVRWLARQAEKGATQRGSQPSHPAVLSFRAAVARNPLYWTLRALSLEKSGSFAALRMTYTSSVAGDERAWFALSAIFAGLAATTKLNGLWVVFGMSAVVLFAPNGMIRPRVVRASGYAAIGLLVVSPWFVRTWSITGNPLYPMAYNLFGGREWTSAGWPRIQRYFYLMNTPPGFAPAQSTLVATRIALTAVALAVAVVVFRRTSHSPLAVPARFSVAFATLLFLSSGFSLRFLLAAYPSVIVCAACGLPSWERPLRYAVPFVAILLGARNALHNPHPDLAAALAVATGRIPGDDYLRQRLPDYPVVEYSNARLPASARILVATWEEETTYYRPLAMRANYWLQDSVHYDSPARLDADLARLGIDYVAFKPMDASWCSRSSVCSGRMEHETDAVQALLQRRGELLFQANGVSLYRLRPG